MIAISDEKHRISRCFAVLHAAAGPDTYREVVDSDIRVIDGRELLHARELYPGQF